MLPTKPARGAPVRSLATACRGCGAYARAPAHAGTAPAASGPACCQHTSAYVSIRQRMRVLRPKLPVQRAEVGEAPQDASAYVSKWSLLAHSQPYLLPPLSVSTSPDDQFLIQNIEERGKHEERGSTQDTSGYARIREDTSAYVRIRRG